MRRAETQLLHFDGVDWHPYSFVWRDDQTDAHLAPADGAEKEVRDGKATRLWQFHSRSQCMSCHNSWSEYALAFQPEQLNRPGADGRNQLVALTELGLIRRAAEDGKPQPAFDPDSVKKERTVADPTDASQPLEARARAYLHANCGHCHTFGAGGAVDLRLQLPGTVEEMKAVGVRPTKGDFGLPDACIIKPGDPFASTLYFRMAKFGRDRMPHIGSDVPDEAGLELIEKWIASMGKADPVPDKAAPDKLLVDPKAALFVARQLGSGKLKPPERNALLAEATKLEPGPVRDLFDGYLPTEKGGRKLGSSPRPRTILALKGDAQRGETLFWSKALNCSSCHKVGGRGTEIGPDLSTIGKLRPREDLLESILEPSRRIEPKYAAYVARLADGRTFTGLVVKRDEKEVVLRDAQNKEIVLAAKNVEELRPSPKSLMPDGQLAGLTVQEAADLLEYLGTRK